MRELPKVHDLTIQTWALFTQTAYQNLPYVGLQSRNNNKTSLYEYNKKFFYHTTKADCRILRHEKLIALKIWPFKMVLLVSIDRLVLHWERCYQLYNNGRSADCCCSNLGVSWHRCFCVGRSAFMTKMELVVLLDRLWLKCNRSTSSMYNFTNYW